MHMKCDFEFKNNGTISNPQVMIEVFKNKRSKEKRSSKNFDGAP